MHNHPNEHPKTVWKHTPRYWKIPLTLIVVFNVIILISLIFNHTKDALFDALDYTASTFAALCLVYTMTLLSQYRKAFNDLHEDYATK